MTMVADCLRQVLATMKSRGAILCSNGCISGFLLISGQLWAVVVMVLGETAEAPQA